MKLGILHFVHFAPQAGGKNSIIVFDAKDEQNVLSHSRLLLSAIKAVP